MALSSQDSLMRAMREPRLRCSDRTAGHTPLGPRLRATLLAGRAIVNDRTETTIGGLRPEDDQVVSGGSLDKCVRAR